MKQELEFIYTYDPMTSSGNTICANNYGTKKARQLVVQSFNLKSKVTYEFALPSFTGASPINYSTLSKLVIFVHLFFSEYEED